MDILDLGFNIVIGLVVLYILCWWGMKIKKMIEKQKKEGNKELEDDLDDFLGV